MTRTLNIDRDICAGHGRCHNLVPKLFESDDAGYPIILLDEVPDGLLEDAESAVRNCPEGAISLT